MRLVIQARGCPASGLIDSLRDIEGLEIIEWQGKELGIAAGGLWDMVAGQVIDGHSSQLVFHRPQPVLDVAAAVAASRPVGDGAWMWDRQKSPADISPLVAVTGALWDATRVDEPVVVSAYESSALMFV